MQSFDSEHNSSDEQVYTDVKNPVGRPRTAIWRYEDNKYNNKPKAETYFNDYYTENLKHVYIECPHCKSMIGKKNYARHISSGKKCLKIRSLEKSI